MLVNFKKMVKAQIKQKKNVRNIKRQIKKNYTRDYLSSILNHIAYSSSREFSIVISTATTWDYIQVQYNFTPNFYRFSLQPSSILKNHKKIKPFSNQIQHNNKIAQLSDEIFHSFNTKVISDE